MDMGWLTWLAVFAWAPERAAKGGQRPALQRDRQALLSEDEVDLQAMQTLRRANLSTWQRGEGCVPKDQVLP